LADFLADFKNTVIVVSHDRYFLDMVCTHIVDIDFNSIKIYTGNYTFWYESSQLMTQQMASFMMNKGEKIALFSRDSAILTAFFEVLSGEKKADSGTIEYGQTIKMEYLPNENEEFFVDKNDLNLIDWLRQFSPGEKDEQFIRGFLGRMLFSGEEVHKMSSVLSGGEKVRCMLSKTMFQLMNSVGNRVIEIGPNGMVDHLPRRLRKSEKITLRFLPRSDQLSPATRSGPPLKSHCTSLD